MRNTPAQLDASEAMDARGAPDALARAFQRRDRRALARLISRIDEGQDAAAIFAQLPPATSPALTIGITGAAGAGKSTLIGALLRHVLDIGKRIAVLACDPSSARTGGALLGDRVRMQTDDSNSAADPPFIRSISTRPGDDSSGGVAGAAADVIELLDRFGFDVILLESIGTGQDQIAARSLCRLLVLVSSPETGDDVQWDKAGIAEWADMIVLNKADLPGTPRTAATIRAAIALNAPSHDGTAGPEFLQLSARGGEGIDRLWHTLETLAARQRPEHGRHEDAAQALARRLRARIARRIDQVLEQESAQQILRACAQGVINVEEAEDRLIALPKPDRMPLRINT
ncbi:MAG: GTP-binding protein [Phycisphaeraceae bacterium]